MVMRREREAGATLMNHGDGETREMIAIIVRLRTSEGGGDDTS